MSKNSYSAKKIRQAIYKLESILGWSAIDALIRDLENSGLTLDSENAEYSVRDIEIALEKVFGQDVSALLVEKIIKSLAEE